MRFTGLVLAVLTLFLTSAARGDGDGSAALPAPAAAGAAKPSPGLDAPVERVPDPWPEVPSMSLHGAVAAGKVEASGSSPKSYRAVTLRLRNRAATRAAIDIAGSHLTPRKRGSCQRLGIGPAITPSATIPRGERGAVVLLEAGEEREIDVQTCCLDLGLPAPSTDEFEASGEPLPKVRADVLRWWADHPKVPQYAVNSAIWTNSAKVDVPDANSVAARPAIERSATTRRGVYYELTDGELTSTDQEGVRRLLGNGIVQVLPSDDGLYSVQRGADRKPALFVLEMTGERCWTRVMDLEPGNPVHEVFLAPNGGLVVVSDRGVDLRERRTGAVRRVVEAGPKPYFSVGRAGAGRLTFSAHQPAVAPSRSARGGEQDGKQEVLELWTLSLATGKSEVAHRFWNVHTLRAGAGGVFALEPSTDRLRKLVGERFEDCASAGQYERIVAVTAEVVWLASRDGFLVAVDTRTGGTRFRTGVAVAQAGADNIDPVTGDLAFVKGDSFRVIRASGDGRDEALPKPR